MSQKATKQASLSGTAAQRRATSEPSSEAKTFAGIQHSLGNQVLLRMFRTGAIQASLRVSQPGNADEVEADRVAEQVVSSGDRPAVHRKCECEGGDSCPACEEEPVEQDKGIHRRAEGQADAGTHVGDDFARSLGAGEPLDPQTRKTMEAGMGHDFGGVRIHSDAAAAQSARSIQARAYTLDRNIVFDHGAYAPGTREGQKLIAHELTHVVQQSGGRRANRVQRETDTTESKQPQQQKKSEPGIFSRIGHGIAEAAGAIGHGFAEAGKAVWKGIKAVGHGIAVAAGAVWKGIEWLGGQVADKVAGVFERVWHWVSQLPARVGRVMRDLWEAVKSVRPWALAWWKSLAEISTYGHFIQWLLTLLLHLFELGGGGEIIETLADLIKFNTRKLTAGEVFTAASVFGKSIDFSLVRIDTHSLLVFIAKKFKGYSKGREFTTFHTINGEEGAIETDTLIHELTHVWQYQQVGAIYMPQAIHAQGTPEGYDYGGVPGLQSKKDSGEGIRSFNREQQAQIVQDYFRIRRNQRPMVGEGTPTDLPLYAHFVKEVSTLGERYLASWTPSPKGDFETPPDNTEKRMA